MKVTKLDIAGILQLKDNLAAEYFIHTEPDNQYINLTSELNKSIGENIQIQLIHIKNGKDLFKAEGLLTKIKNVTEDFYIGDQNLSDVLWILSKTNMRLIIDEYTNDKEGGVK